MLPSLTVAFLLGLLVGSYIPFFPVALLGLLVTLAFGLTILERSAGLETQRGIRWYGALLAGVAYWSLLTPVPGSPDPPDRRDLALMDVVGRIVSPVQHASGRQTLLIEAEHPIQPTEQPDAPVKLKIVWRDPGTLLLQGDRIEFRAKLHPPHGSRNPGGFDYARYLERQGIDAVAMISGSEALHRLESGAASWRWAGWNQVDRWRSFVREAAVRTLSQPALGLFLGIVIGERGYLQQDLQEWFMVTGTIHLLSISGSHLGLVALVVFWVVRQAVLRLPSFMLLAASRRLTASRVAVLMTWPMVVAYALLAGAELATMRSLVMITVAFVTVWIGHERQLHHAMAIAALLILIHDPRALFDISFQLSFLSVLIIIQLVLWSTGPTAWTDEPAPSLFRRLRTYGRDALLMSSMVTIATLPIVALYFNQVPWLGIVTNLIAIPFTGIILVPLGLVTAVWTILAGAERIAFGWVQEQLVSWLVAGLRWCAALPAAEWHVPAPSLPSMILFYIGLGMACAVGIAGRLRLCGAGLVLVLICWWMWAPRLTVDGDHWRVTFLDVGQGDSAVIELPDGQTVLIDGGARYERFDMGRGVVAPFLWNRGIRRIDHVIGTHQQLDHVGGLVWVLRHFSVGRYWGTGVARPEQFVLDLVAALHERRIPEGLAVRGQDVLPSGPCRLMIVNPASAGIHPVSQSFGGSALNNLSIVSRLQCGVHAILFTGDIEVEGLRRLDADGRRPVTVLKVPHHGGKSSLDRDWIKEIHPRYAVISVGQANSYGHPVPAVLQAYAEEEAVLARTDRDGAVWVTGRLSSPDLTLTRLRDHLLQAIDLRNCLWSCEKENWRRMWTQLSDEP